MIILVIIFNKERNILHWLIGSQTSNKLETETVLFLYFISLFDIVWSENCIVISISSTFSLIKIKTGPNYLNIIILMILHCFPGGKHLRSFFSSLYYSSVLWSEKCWDSWAGQAGWISGDDGEKFNFLVVWTEKWTGDWTTPRVRFMSVNNADKTTKHSDQTRINSI